MKKLNQASVNCYKIMTIILSLTSYLFFKLKFLKRSDITEDGNILQREELNKTRVK
jgi:hypothetical protein